MKNKVLYIFTIFIMSLVFIGCQGSSKSDSNIAKSETKSSVGVLIDDVISGIKYINGEINGFTNEKGEFPYTSGKVEFYLGNIKIGEIDSLTSDNKIFIQDLIGLERTNIDDEKVLKIATLLQSLDSDDSTDAIEIKRADFDKFNSNSNSIIDTVKIVPKENLVESKLYTIRIKVAQINNYNENNNDDTVITFSAKTVKPTLQTNMDQKNDVSISNKNWSFSGMARDDNGIESINLILNGITSNIELKNNFFNIEKELNVGENIYKINVIDIEGNESLVEGKITVDLSTSNDDYLIKTNVEKNKIVTLTSVWEFKGEIKTGTSISKLTLELNGVIEDIVLVEGKFNIAKDLNLGLNNYKIIIEDDTSKKEIKQGTIYLGSVITAGGSHSGAIKADKVYTWGRNNYGQAGLGYTSKLSDETNGVHPKTPIKIITPTKFVSLSFMQNFSVAIDENGDVYIWGYDKNGELGRGKENRDNCSKTEDCRLSIGKVEGLSNIVAIDAGLSHTLALDKSGDVYAFGTNRDGELGNGTKISDARPVKVIFPEDNIKIVQITAGSDFSMAIDKNGELWGWGKNNYGQMAEGNKGNDKVTPLKITVGQNEKVKSVTAGTGHILVLTQGGDIYGWGNNYLSQVGYRGYQYRNSNYAWASSIYTPTKILTNYKNNPVVQVYAGGHSSYILREDRKVYPWGMYGETKPNGKQQYNNLDFPEDKLTAITSVKDMAAGALHVTAIKEDNTVFTWRWSFEGSLGGGDSTTNIWFYNYPIIPNFPSDNVNLDNLDNSNSNELVQQSTLTPPGGNATVGYSLNAPFLKISNNISENEISGVSQGRELFIAQWNPALGNRPTLDGLGPLFNANACSSCHISNGRVSAYNSNGTTDKSFLFRIGNENGDVHPVFGGQLQTQATSGASETSMTWRKNSSNKIEFISSTDVTSRGFNIGGRISPHLIGMGLLDLISEDTILEYEDINDSNNDGISGRAHWVIEEGKRRIGRSGWKAINSSLRTQNATALHQDMGLTTPINPSENCTNQQAVCSNEPNGGTPEVSETALQQIVDFMTALSVPDRRINNQEKFDGGFNIFETIGCASCHRPSMTTGISSKFLTLSNQKIYPYTDLLLHDMGESLSDGVKEKDALGNEFRTPPLWGIGIVKQKQGARFLHDGRASSIQEAIQLHSGEAQNARDKFIQLSTEEVDKLMEFLTAI